MDANIVYQVPDLEPFQLSATADGLTFEKEVIHVGRFQKGDKQFSITPSNLQHWRSTHERMQAAGITVPMPVEHTEDPEAKRADLLKLSVRKNSRGKDALFATLKFRDAEAAKLRNSDVSIYVPTAYDVNGVKYPYPIKHIAFTDYPAITGLDKFEALAASLVSTGDSKMALTLQQIADKIGVQGAVQMADDAAETAIIALCETNKKRIADLEQMVTDLGGDPNAKPEPPAEGEGGDKAPPTVTASNSTMRGIVKENREGKIDRLVAERRITPAQAAALKKTHCADTALELSLTKEDKTFDNLFDVLKTNTPIMSNGKDGKSGSQSLELSNQRNDTGTKKNHLIADAEKRAEEAKKK